MLKRAKEVSKLNDKKLVARILSGEESLFAELVRRHQMRVYQIAYGLVGTHDDADDLAQLTFLKVYRSLHRFQGNSQFTTWLYRICTNCCYDWMKTNKRWVQKTDDTWWADLSANDILFAREVTSDQHVINGEMRDMLDEALGNLSPEFRTVFVLREINGLSYEEIADIVACEVGTVKSRLFRARSQLRKLLAHTRAEWLVA